MNDADVHDIVHAMVAHFRRVNGTHAVMTARVLFAWKLTGDFATREDGSPITATDLEETRASSMVLDEICRQMEGTK